MKVGGRVQVNMHRLTVKFLIMSYFEDGAVAAMTSFHSDKCCHLVSEYEASAGIYVATSISS